MKLIRFGEPGRERPGLLLPDGTRLDASGFGADYDEAFFGGGGPDRLRAWLDGPGARAPRVDPGVRLGPPVARPSKIVCIGLNYRDHAAETGAAIPGEPVIFFKATTALVGPDDDLVIPRGAGKVDWEVELAVVIGARARYVSRERAAGHVAGYALHNDYSERAFQLERGGQWSKGKSADTFAPLGPCLATPDEVADPQRLDLWLKVNGELRQRGTTANMVFDVPTLVSYLSEFMTLLPGDVISTGTPAGVGLGMKPEPVYLRPGDVVELGIDGLGQSRQRVVAYPG
jgi:2,4-didehydro-3-deoxy-L-rhamnonate hydrolase